MANQPHHKIAKRLTYKISSLAHHPTTSICNFYKMIHLCFFLAGNNLSNTSGFSEINECTNYYLEVSWTLFKLGFFICKPFMFV